MNFLRKYNSIPGFLHRFTILCIGKLHIRIHKILSVDETQLYHNHPFNYISIILKGGYTEHIFNEEKQTTSIIERKAPCFIFANKNTYHRIHEIYGSTTTMFLAYGKYGWNAINPSPMTNVDGIFKRVIKGKILLCKRQNDIWYIGHQTKPEAVAETRHSIFQKLYFTSE